METPVFAQKTDHIEEGCEQSFAAPMDTRALFLASQEEGVVVLNAGATANLLCFRWLARHNRLLEKYGASGCPHIPRRPDSALGMGGSVRNATQQTGKFTASLLDADTPALLRKGATGALGG